MHHNTFICTDCRRTRRSLLWKCDRYVSHNCPECGKAMYPLSSKWRIPARTDRDTWEDMRFAIACFESARVDLRARLGAAKELDVAQPLTELERVAKPKRKTESRTSRRERARRPAYAAKRHIAVRTDRLARQALMPHYYYGRVHWCKADVADFVVKQGNKTPRYTAWSNPPPEPWILNVFPRRSGRVSARIRAT